MKNKTKTYVLLALVLTVWGIIGYKIITGLNPELPEVTSNNLDVTFLPKEIIKKDTFSIQTTNRDPFLGTLTRKGNKKAVVKTTPKNEPKDINTPQISFQGLIKKQNSSQQVFVVSVNGKQHLLKRGQTIDDVKLIKGNSKEIVVSFNNKLQTIKLQ